ncbi:MAG: YihY family inner membrane protein [Holophagae bacterium]|jgi:membrane protein
MRVFDHLDRLDVRQMPWWEQAAVRTMQFVSALVAQMARDKVIIRASGLAYSSLLAAVPLVAVGFALFSAFGAFDDIQQRVQEFLFSQFLPTSQDEIVAYLNQFAAGTKKLGLIGFLFLVLASTLLLDNIESNFNNIWHVTSRRSLIAKITAYTSVLVFGVLLIGASISVTSSIKKTFLRDVPFDVSTLEKIGNSLFPLVLALLAFLLMYLIIPHTRVRVKSAFMGAAIASVLWEAGKYLFAYSAEQSVRYSTIYGSLAVLPLFLIWLYITWIIVLLGLEIAFTHQHFAALIRSRAAGDRDECDRVTTGLQIYTMIAAKFHKGLDPPTSDELSRRFLVATGSVDSHLDRLVEAGLARRVAFGRSLEGVVPARSLDSVQVADVIGAFVPQPEEQMRQRPIEVIVEGVVSSFRDAGFEAVGDSTMLEVVTKMEGGPSTA